MKRLNVFVIICLMVSAFSAQAGLYRVGNSANCTGSNVFGTLNQALFVAALNGDSSDEIRLTNTVSYTGNTNGSGIYVDNGGSVFANGRTNRIIFDRNTAGEGGAIYVNGTGFVLLQNTHIINSSAPDGSAIYAKDGGSSSSFVDLKQDDGCHSIKGANRMTVGTAAFVLARVGVVGLVARRNFAAKYAAGKTFNFEFPDRSVEKMR